MRADPEIRAHLLRLTEIVKRCPDAIIATDANRIVCDLNPAAEGLFGWPREELVGLSIEVLIPPELREGSRVLWERLVAGEPIEPVESERRRRDGSTVAVELRVLTAGHDDGALTGAVIYRDVSDRRALDRELAAHASRLRSLAARAVPITPTAAGLTVDTGKRIAGALAMLREQLGMQVAWLAEMTEDHEVFRVVDGDRDQFGLYAGRSVPREQTICHQMLTGTIGELVPDARREPALAHVGAVKDGRLGGYIGVPVELSDGRLWGTLCAISSESTPDLGERDIAFLQVLAGLLVDQLEHDRLQGAHERMQSELTASSALLAAVEAREGVTGGRSQEVVELATSVALELGLADREVDAVQQVALLHDLGKLAIPDVVLNSPGPLGEREWELIREHPAIGAGILSTVSPLAHLASIVRAEHERFDGAGYPDGLAGHEIPVIARIVFACDAYHAMRSTRPYQSAVDHKTARAELRCHAGTQFDPDIVAALLAVLDG